MKKVFSVIIILMIVKCVNAQNSVSNNTIRIVSRNLHNTATHGNLKQDILGSHLGSSRFFGGNAVYDQNKMLAVTQKLDNMEFKNYNSVSSAWENYELYAFIYDMNSHNTSATYSVWSKFHNMYKPSIKNVCVCLRKRDFSLS